MARGNYHGHQKGGDGSLKDKPLQEQKSNAVGDQGRHDQNTMQQKRNQKGSESSSAHLQTGTDLTGIPSGTLQ